jgi:hypothetical protein
VHGQFGTIFQYAVHPLTHALMLAFSGMTQFSAGTMWGMVGWQLVPILKCLVSASLHGLQGLVNRLRLGLDKL